MQALDGTMAQSSPAKDPVADFVRSELKRRYGMDFAAAKVKLSTGGSRNFDAVSNDQRVVASIRSRARVDPSGKGQGAGVKAAIAELYFLRLAPGEQRLLVVTEKGLHDRLTQVLEGKLAPEVRIDLVPLAEDLQRQMDSSAKADE